MKTIIFILTLLISNLTFSQIEKESDTLEILTLFSIGNFVNQNAEMIIEKEWPFKINGIAGDTFTEDLIDSVEIHNSRIWKLLDSRGYSDSRNKFESDLSAEISRIKKAQTISESNENVSDLLKKLREEKLQNFTELKKLNDNKYEFTIYSFDLENLNTEQVFEIKFITDIETEKTKIIK